MSYTVKKVGAKKIVTGSYIPKGHTCECKSCDFKIEVKHNTDDKLIADLVAYIRKM
jgi:hypothetical protein